MSLTVLLVDSVKPRGELVNLNSTEITQNETQRKGGGQNRASRSYGATVNDQMYV